MINDDIELLCGQIKHVPESVQLDDVRAVLRQAQAYIERLETLLSRSTVPGDAVLAVVGECDV